MVPLNNVVKINYLIRLLLIVRMSKCSIVMDVRDRNQKGIHISDYCPTMPYCSEGSHIMCMYYNPNNPIGARCYDARNVSMTAEVANKIVDTVNEIRSKIALGQEKGKGGVALPRAYGMMKVQWDSELATFAQVWANQCIFRHDICRASLNFSNPNQVVGLVRFTHPDWYQVAGRDNFDTPGLNFERIEYAVTTSLKTWYTRKEFATPAMMTSCPDWGKPPHDIKPKLYLAMIHGDTTHIGCGMSAYTEYGYHDNNADVNYNSIQMICNLSTKPGPGGIIYKTSPPSKPGETIRCGCPEGYEEDPDCLCSKAPVEPMPEKLKKCNDDKPAVVLLPIFTVEDARPGQSSNAALRSPHSQFSDIIYLNETTETPAHVLYNAPEHDEHPNMDNFGHINNMLRGGTNSLSVLDSIIEAPRATALRSPRVKNKVARIPAVVENRYFGRKPNIQDAKSVLQRNDQALKKKKRIQGSLFSKAHTFELPGHHRLQDKLKDVAPRKDFSKAQSLLNTYMSKRRNHEPIDNLDLKDKAERRNNHISALNRYMKNKFNYHDFNVSTGAFKSFNLKNNYSSEEADAKLMNLLDNLEQEVKHIELDMNEKEIFDAKIRKIYGTVVGGSTNILNNRRRALLNKKDTARYARLINRVNADSLDDINKMVYDNEDKVKEAHSKFMDKYNKQNRLFKRPLLRNIDGNTCLDRNKNCLKNYRQNLDRDGKIDLTRIRKHDPFNEKIENPIYDSHDFSNRDLNKEIAVLDSELKNRRVYKNNRDRVFYDDKNFFKPKDTTYYDDPLSADRRKYYQDKIDNIERKIHEGRNYRFRKQLEQSMRIRPTNRDDIMRPSRTKDMFYIPDRARLLHGF